jgi:Rrf2 family protein
MIISTKIRYGLRALIEIAAAPENEGILQKNIALNQDISIKYLDHIIRDLKNSGLICNFKNKKSGYRLCKLPKDINIYLVYLAFEPELCLIECFDSNSFCARHDECATQPVWRELNRRMIEFMKSVSLQDIIDGKYKQVIDVHAEKPKQIRHDMLF